MCNCCNLCCLVFAFSRFLFKSVFIFFLKLLWLFGCISYISFPCAVGTKFSISRLEDHQVRTYHNTERQQMHSLLETYKLICERAGVFFSSFLLCNCISRLHILQNAYISLSLGIKIIVQNILHLIKLLMKDTFSSYQKAKSSSIYFSPIDSGYKREVSK